MFRRLFTPGAVLSLILCALSVLLLFGSFFDELDASTVRIEAHPAVPPPKGQVVQVYRGVLLVSGRLLVAKSERPTNVRVQWGWTLRPRPNYEGTTGLPIGILGFWWDGIGTSVWEIAIPLWPVALITAVLPYWWLRDHRRRKGRGFVPITNGVPPENPEIPS